jgi:hypothetical protein
MWNERMAVYSQEVQNAVLSDALSGRSLHSIISKDHSQATALYRLLQSAIRNFNIRISQCKSMLFMRSNQTKHSDFLILELDDRPSELSGRHCDLEAATSAQQSLEYEK